MSRCVTSFLHLSKYASSLAESGKNSHAIVYGGVDDSRFYPLNVDRERKVLFVGRLLPHKGINYLIEAVDANTTLVIIGKPYSKPYAELLRGLAETKKVTFIEDADDEALLYHYNTSSVFVLPSVYEDVYGNKTKVPELLGLVVLEAMACGTPVIATDVASLPELICDGKTGRIVPPNSPQALRQAIYEILDNAQLVQLYGQEGLGRFRDRFTWKQVVKGVLASYGI